MMKHVLALLMVFALALPYRITVSEQAHSYPDQELAKFFIYSAGADSARPITMRLKPSTGALSNIFDIV